MNCKPGDLARYVGRWKHAHGMIFQILEPHPTDPGAWIVAPRFPSPRLGTGDSIWDHALRPIRDTGDDATDETLSWLPVPSVEGVTA